MTKEIFILILGKDLTQGLGEHSLFAEKIYSINFTKFNPNFCLSLHYNGANICLFVNGTEIDKFTVKDSEIVPNNLCLGNLSKNVSASNMKKKNRFNDHIYDFSVDFDSIDVDHIKDINKYLIKKNDSVKMFRFIKEIFASTLMYFRCNLSSVNL